mgnify:CR=1 FL=1
MVRFLLALVLATCLALLLAYAARMSRSRWPQGMNRVVGLGYAVPGSVIAVGVLYLLVSRHMPVPAIPGLDFSFSGIKTAFLGVVRKGEAERPTFAQDHRDDLCASLQRAIIDHLLAKTRRAMRDHGIRSIGIAGGVAANSGLRARLIELGAREGWDVFVPPFAYCTDNAAMIAMAGHHLFLAGKHAPLNTVPMARFS